MGQSEIGMQSAAQLMSLGNRQFQKSNQESQLGLGHVESPQTTQASEQMSSMSELDRYGLAPVLQLARRQALDSGVLVTGQDLTSLGLDLSQPEYELK